jgi:hypothetical protein
MLSNSGVKNGIFLGVASTLFSHICYMINPKMMLNGVAFLGFLIYIFFMYRSAVEERSKNEGLLSFGEALKVTFITYIIGSFVSTIYMYLMFNVIDPGLYDVMKEINMDNAEFFTKLLGGEDQLDQVQDQIENQTITMSFSMLFLNFLVSLIFPGFVFSLIISALTKKAEA